MKKELTSEQKAKKREAQKRYRDKNKESLKQKAKEYFQDNKEKRKEYLKEYRSENKDKTKKYNKKSKNRIKQWNIDNKEHRKQYEADYRRNKRHTDLLYKLKSNISSMFYNALKRKGYTKKSKSIDILGCSIEEFKKHLESQFEPWMNWDNKGLYNGQPNYGWDIDHITPLSTATNENEVVRLNHFTNLRPLCSYINRYVKKGNTLEF